MCTRTPILLGMITSVWIRRMYAWGTSGYELRIHVWVRMFQNSEFICGYVWIRTLWSHNMHLFYLSVTKFITFSASVFSIYKLGVWVEHRPCMCAIAGMIRLSCTDGSCQTILSVAPFDTYFAPRYMARFLGMSALAFSFFRNFGPSIQFFLGI
jgi:hypothetical protein